MRRTCVAPCPRVRYVYRQVDPAAPPPPWLMPNTSAQANEKEKNIFCKILCHSQFFMKKARNRNGLIFKQTMSILHISDNIVYFINLKKNNAVCVI